jgi:hypothetical protein
VNGGSGTDTVQFSGNRSQYSLARSTDSSGIQTVTDIDNKIIYLATPDRAFKVSGPDGNDTLVDVEKLKFKDGIYDIATGAFTEEDNSSSSKGKKGKNKKSKGRKGKKSKR